MCQYEIYNVLKNSTDWLSCRDIKSKLNNDICLGAVSQNVKKLYDNKRIRKKKIEIELKKRLPKVNHYKIKR